MPDDQPHVIPSPRPLDRGHPQPPGARERGISQEPVPAPDGPLVADVGMHDDDLASGAVGFAVWAGVAVFVALLLILTITRLPLR